MTERTKKHRTRMLFGSLCASKGYTYHTSSLPLWEGARPDNVGTSVRYQNVPPNVWHARARVTS